MDPAKIPPEVPGFPDRLPSVVVGFDAFVDELISLVAERHSLDSFTPVADISAFGKLVIAAAGHSSLREIVVSAVHPGGCAINLGDGLAALGVPVDCFATMGEPRHPVFSAACRRFRSANSWGTEPGRTLAFEFQDGKLMFSSVSQLAKFTPVEVKARLMDGAYLKACEAAGVIALTDWTLYPHMTGVWKLLLDEVYGRLVGRPDFFFDLVDPSSRSASDVRAMLEVIPDFEGCGAVTLGLNGGEANLLARLLGHQEADNGPSECLRLAAELREALGISAVIIHRNRFAVGATAEETAAVEGPHCAKPKKSTGAGDRFNAGFIAGLLVGASLKGRLTLGCATAGFFVREARSASRDELSEFLARWQGGHLS
jgi:hypothetical protein